jgi:hypothetical protein
MVEKLQVGVRMDAEIKDALIRAAAADDRTVSALINRVLADWLRKHGWLAPASVRRAKK